MPAQSKHFKVKQVPLSNWKPDGGTDDMHRILHPPATSPHIVARDSKGQEAIDKGYINGEELHPSLITDPEDNTKKKAVRLPQFFKDDEFDQYAKKKELDELVDLMP